MPEKPKLENAKTEIFGFGVLFSLTRHLILSLPSGEMSRSDKEGRLPCEGAGLPLCGKTEGVLQIDKIRMRLALMQTYPRAAPSVTACAVPPSSVRKALVLRTGQTRLSLWERCRAATERAGSLVRELACRLAARLREFYKLARYAGDLP